MDYVWAFLIGGGICLLGQILMDTTRLTAPRILAIFVVTGALLTGLGLYQPVVELAKTGATVPIPGFGYSLAKGAMDAVNVDGFMGALVGGGKYRCRDCSGDFLWVCGCLTIFSEIHSLI